MILSAQTSRQLYQSITLSLEEDIVHSQELLATWTKNKASLYIHSFTAPLCDYKVNNSDVSNYVRTLIWKLVTIFSNGCIYLRLY